MLRGSSGPNAIPMLTPMLSQQSLLSTATSQATSNMASTQPLVCDFGPHRSAPSGPDVVASSPTGTAAEPDPDAVIVRDLVGTQDSEGAEGQAAAAIESMCTEVRAGCLGNRTAAQSQPAQSCAATAHNHAVARVDLEFQQRQQQQQQQQQQQCVPLPAHPPAPPHAHPRPPLSPFSTAGGVSNIGACVLPYYPHASAAHKPPSLGGKEARECRSLPVPHSAQALEVCEYVHSMHRDQRSLE